MDTSPQMEQKMTYFICHAQTNSVLHCCVTAWTSYTFRNLLHTFISRIIWNGWLSYLWTSRTHVFWQFYNTVFYNIIYFVKKSLSLPLLWHLTVCPYLIFFASSVILELSSKHFFFYCRLGKCIKCSVLYIRP